MPYANNKGADQPAHPRSLISAFVVDNISSFYIRNFKPLTSFSVAAQAGLSLTLSKNLVQIDIGALFSVEFFFFHCFLILHVLIHFFTLYHCDYSTRMVQKVVTRLIILFANVIAYRSMHRSKELSFRLDHGRPNIR